MNILPIYRHAIGLAALLVPAVLWSQTAADSTTTVEPFYHSSRFGIHELIDIAEHRADFTALPGVPTCCPRYTSAHGLGASFALIYEHPFAKAWLPGLRLAFQTVNGTFRSLEGTTFIVNGVPTPGTFEHTLETSYATLSLQPTFGYRFLDHILKRLDLVGYLGVGVSVPLYSHFDQSERIAEPRDVGLFTGTDESSRNAQTGAIPDINSLQTDLSIGLSMDVPLNRTRTLLLAPELWYSYGLSDVVRSLDWRTNTLRVGLAIKYLPRSEPETVASAVGPGDPLGSDTTSGP